MSHHPGENPDFSGRPGQYGPGSRGPHPGAYGAYPPPGKRPWYKRVGCVVSMIVALGLLLFGGCGAAALLAATTAVMAPDGTSQGGQAQPGGEPAATSTEPEFTVTADALLKELDENALSAADKYKGKMVQVTGTLTNIDSSGDYFSLGPTKGDSVTLTGVQVFLDEGQRSTVAGFKKGQKITVVGEMRGVGEVIGYTMNAASMKVTT